MKILEQSDSRFVVQRSPLSQMLGGGVAIAVGVVVAEITLTHGTPLLGLIGAAIVAVGVVLALTATRLTVAVDRPDGTISIAAKSVLRARDRAVPIADVDCVSYQERYYSQLEYTGDFWHRQSRRRDTSVLALKDGSTVLLESEDISTFGTMFSGSKDRTIDHELAAFIGVPLVTGDTPGTGETLADIEQALGIGQQPESLVAPEPEPLVASEPEPVIKMPPAPADVAPAGPTAIEPEPTTTTTTAEPGEVATAAESVAAAAAEPAAETAPAQAAAGAEPATEPGAKAAPEPPAEPEPVVEPAPAPELAAEPEPGLAAEPEPELAAEPEPAPEPIAGTPAPSPALPLTPGLFHPLPGQSFVPPADAPRPPWLS
jgi:hypothetical protein